MIPFPLFHPPSPPRLPTSSPLFSIVCSAQASSFARSTRLENGKVTSATQATLCCLLSLLKLHVFLKSSLASLSFQFLRSLTCILAILNNSSTSLLNWKSKTCLLSKTVKKPMKPLRNFDRRLSKQKNECEFLVAQFLLGFLPFSQAQLISVTYQRRTAPDHLTRLRSTAAKY